MQATNKLFSVSHVFNGVNRQAAVSGDLFRASQLVCEKYQVDIAGFEYKLNGEFSEVWCDDETLVALMNAGHEGATNLWLEQAFG